VRLRLSAQRRPKDEKPQPLRRAESFIAIAGQDPERLRMGANSNTLPRRFVMTMDRLRYDL